MRTARLLPVLALVLSGCAVGTRTTDPFEGLGTSRAEAAQPPLYPGLSLAVILSENTRRSAEVAREVEARSMGQVPAGAVFKETFDFLGRNFKSVTRAESLEEAFAAGHDAVAVLDMSMRVAATIHGQERVETRLLFMAPGKQLLAEASASGSASAKETPFSIVASARSAKAFMMASRRSTLALYPSLRDVQHLARLQASKGGAGAATVAAVTAAPAEASSYRSDVDRPAFSLPEDASKFALVVGVEKYQNLPAAEHAVRDAAAVKAHLRAAGYPERNIVYLTDAQAGKSGLEKHLDAWLPKNVAEGATLFFYFSGHGAPDTAKGDAYLMPWDADAKFVESTGYPVKRLYQKLSALKAGRVLVVMDACFSGAGGRSVLAKGTRPLVGKTDLGVSAAGRVTALTAAAADEITGTDEETGHGLFTYHLLKGLSAKGGKASFKDLHDYLSPKVRDAARRENRDQTPQLIGAGADPL
jgi:hypothetical protein